MIEIENIYNQKINLLKFKNYIENNNFNDIFSIGYKHTNEYPFFMFVNYGRGLNEVFKNIEILLFDKYFEILKNEKNKQNTNKLDKSSYLKIRNITTSNLKKYFEMLNIATINNIFDERKINFSDLFFKVRLSQSDRNFLIKHELEHIKNDYFKYILLSLGSESYTNLQLIQTLQEKTNLGILFNIYSDYIINLKLNNKDTNISLHMINNNNILDFFPNLDLELIKNTKDTTRLFNYFIKYLNNNTDLSSIQSTYVSDIPELNTTIKNYIDLISKLKKFNRKEDINLINNFINEYFKFLTKPLIKEDSSQQINNLTLNILNY